MSEPDILPDQPAEVHFQIGQKAADRLGRLVDGNGLKAEQVRVARHETLVHQIPAAIHIALKPDVVKSQLKGKRPHGQVMANEAAIMGLAAGIATEHIASKDVQVELMQHIEKDQGRGWGMKPFRLPLAVTKRDFCVVDECTKCGGQASYACTVCNKSGAVPCPGCNAQGMSQCQSCFGAGAVDGQDGGRVPCPTCNATGRTTCRTCQGATQLRCGKCAGKGIIGCTECDQSGFWTWIFDMSFHAEASFEVDRQHLPQDVQAVMEHLGIRHLATEGHAEIFRLGEVPEEKFLTIPYVAFLPIATVEFSIEGKQYPATVAGLTGLITHIDPLLDNIVKPGINALFKLAKGPLAAEALVDQACKFRVIRKTLSGLAHHSKRQVYQQIIKEYPLVLSDKYAKAIVKYADNALAAMARAPKTKGLMIGTVLGAAISAGYFMTPAHAYVQQTFAMNNKPQLQIAGDIAVYLVSFIAAWLTIKFTAAGALKKLLPDNVKSEEDKGLPPAGKQGVMAAFTVLAAWLALAFFAIAKPDWVAAILAHLPR